MTEIRNAVRSDAPRLLEIYGWYVRHTAITFEYDVPTLEDFQGRMEGVMAHWPWLVILRDGAVEGYAYAGPFHSRAAYGWCCELSVYLDPAERGKGLGRALYEALEAALGRMGLCNLYACIALPEQEDEYLSRASVDFHARMGYHTVGTFRSCGYKFSRWYHMVWMEKVIGAHRPEMPPVRPWPALSPREGWRDCPPRPFWNKS